MTVGRSVMTPVPGPLGRAAEDPARLRRMTIRPRRFGVGRPVEPGQEVGLGSISHCLREAVPPNQALLKGVGRSVAHLPVLFDAMQLIARDAL